VNFISQDNLPAFAPFLAFVSSIEWWIGPIASVSKSILYEAYSSFC